MMFQRIGSAAVVALTCALVLMSSAALASTEGDDFTTSLGCLQRFIGDGDCDLQNDTEDCDFDGGDCCECTCVSTDDYTCGENGGYFCVDPSAPCVDDDDVTTVPEFEVFCVPDFVADGDCDDQNNFEDCGYDGGDCCECTCVSTADYTCGDNGGFACLDPTADCFDGDGSFTFGDDMSASFSFEMYDMPN